MRLESSAASSSGSLRPLLVAQSLEENLPLLSGDALLEPYGVDIRW